MTIKGYILIEVVAGKVGSVLKEVASIEGVKSADAVTGPYDVIATVEAEDVNSLGKTVTNKIQNIDGILRTATCLAVKL